MAADLSLILMPQTQADQGAIEKLDERTFGPGRFARSAYRLREGQEPDYALSFVARVGTLLVGANRITRIRCGDTQALLLGPLTVEPAFRSGGIGEALVLKSLEAAQSQGHELVLLVGDEPYYARMGFRPVPPGHLTFIGPVDPARLLYCELREGALERARGRVKRC
ncbi:GNAT family N-acetyltransferase [Beijerinckia indica]|uniref:GCN5-related N-acetyltransferase n=1 Tax=Beijerinckia indica subsp. indica (strain ATCC 9039 / DSM 1715 / NCIMB 8712) TaxID=395963 RepID=B2IEN9_BEII9|nr:N-acetyltransferase [Beijerinckia indica]ACB96979.1 GCN5-related N-acetyltransferase [Beijerinckia indica subsp. indica ATCC 9039]